MDQIKFFQNRILPYWKTYIVILAPLFLAPLISLGKESRAGYVILIMAIYWTTEAIPLPATALLPVVLFPLFGIMDTGKVCTSYMKETNVMFIGGLFLAQAIEYCNLHRRIALRFLMIFGARTRWLMLGFMATTAFLSMWISNTATTAMMVPIVEAVVEELFKDDEEVNVNNDEMVRIVPDGAPSLSSAESNNSINTDFCLNEDVQTTSIGSATSLDSGLDVGISRQQSALTLDEDNQREASRKEERSFRICVLTAVGYASSIGGTGSLIGSSPQLALKGILQDLYGNAPGLSFATWMAFNLPVMTINIFLAWIWLQYLFIGFKKLTKIERSRETHVKQLIHRECRELGSMTFHEIATLLLFIICVLLWFFRDPQFMPGWSELIPAVEVDDATAVMAIIMLLFIIPAKPKFWRCFRPTGEIDDIEKPSSSLLDWKYAQDKLPWGIVLLLGGGFALSDASQISGLSKWLGLQLTGLQVLHPFFIMLIVCVMTATITEVASNTATANILLPILSEMAVSIRINPLFLMLPATVTCSYAFMLPVATPPNAIVYSAGHMNSVDMMKAGFMMNIICVVVICIFTYSYGNLLFDFNEFPSWAIKNSTDTLSLAMSSSAMTCSCEP